MKINENIKNKKKFLEKYGHLRPSTYDITIKNYKNGYFKYFGSTFNKQTGKENKKNKKRTYIDKKFISKSTSIPINEKDNLFKYFQDTIIERERSN